MGSEAVAVKVDERCEAAMMRGLNGAVSVAFYTCGEGLATLGRLLGAIAMKKTILQGRLSHRCRSFAVMWRTIAGVLLRRLLGRPLVPGWTPMFEIGTLFYRHQFNHALSLPDIAEGRAYFDSFYTIVEPDLPVEHRPSGPGEPAGDWYTPQGGGGGATLLYLHGGGYAFYGMVSRLFIASLSHHLQVRVFAPDYRLTPEHPHPAQLDDALAAYRHLLAQGVPPRQLVVGGDSAGGHLALMLLAALRPAGLPQPALALGISPWTDIGRRGESQFGNDRYDMVQGWQTLRYGEWLKQGTGLGDAALSPTHQDYRGAAPIYLQAGSHEILVDMIREFAHIARGQGAAVRLDVWPKMTHEFHGHGPDLPQAREALAALRSAIVWATTEGAPPWPASVRTELDALVRRESVGVVEAGAA